MAVMPSINVCVEAGFVDGMREIKRGIEIVSEVV